MTGKKTNNKQSSKGSAETARSKNSQNQAIFDDDAFGSDDDASSVVKNQDADLPAEMVVMDDDGEEDYVPEIAESEEDGGMAGLYQDPTANIHHSPVHDPVYGSVDEDDEAFFKPYQDADDFDTNIQRGRRQKLPQIEPRHGFQQRWVKILNDRNEISYTQIQKQIAGVGWRARPLSTIPRGVSLPVQKIPNIGGAVVVMGHMLCEMPERLGAQIRKSYSMKAEDQRQEAERKMMLGSISGHDARPTYDDSQSSVEYGIGNKVDQPKGGRRPKVNVG